MLAEQQGTEESDLLIDKAKSLVRRLGDGDFRKELAAFPNTLMGKKAYTFSEMRRTQAVAREVRHLDTQP